MYIFSPNNLSALTVIKLQHLVVDWWSHADGLAREVWVVVESLPQ